MRIHHERHHQTYITNLNAAEQSLKEATAANDVKKVIGLQSALNFHGGGHLNHTLFWESLAPASAGGGNLPSGSSLAKRIETDFGGLDSLKSKMNAALAGIQGSGWGWLVRDADSGALKVTTTANQDPITRDTVILGIDAWEHAYYLQYENAKAKYFENIWTVINWETASKRFDA